MIRREEIFDMLSDNSSTSKMIDVDDAMHIFDIVIKKHQFEILKRNEEISMLNRVIDAMGEAFINCDGIKEKYDGLNPDDDEDFEYEDIDPDDIIKEIAMAMGFRVFPFPLDIEGK